MFPDQLLYTKDHEWYFKEGNVVRVGITYYAQHKLGDVVFVDLPEEGATIKRGDSFAVVESVKAVSDIYAPVGGRIVSVNDALEYQPELINKEPYGKGWLVLIDLSDLFEVGEGLTADQYKEHVGEA